MPKRLFSRFRSASAIAAGLALLIVGAAAGAAGDALILGQSNDSGTAQTTLANAGTGAAFTLKTTNVSSGATGIFGWSSSTGANSTRGVYGRADGPNSYGVFGRNTGAAGTGAAIYAEGNANPGLIVDVDSNSVAPIKVNSTAMVANLNADLLDGLQGNSLTRFAYNTDDNDALVGASGTVISTTITAPTRGWLRISASSDVFGTAADALACNLDVDGTNIAASTRTIEVDGAGNSEEDCSTNSGYFTCGGTHTVRLEGSGVAATTTFDEATIEVTFHPYAGDGSRPSIFPCVIILTPEAGWTIDN